MISGSTTIYAGAELAITRRSDFILKRKLKKAGRVTIGIFILVVGLIMLVTPGPALVVIPTGLAILSSDFAWARLALMKLKKKYRSVRQNKKIKKASMGSFCMGANEY